jgi:outer membrane protein assembly factor BamD
MKKCLILGVCLFIISGCSLFEESGQMNKSAQQLANEGSSAFMSQDYTDAVKAYTDLKDWYPFSKYAILAELKIADAHFTWKSMKRRLWPMRGLKKCTPRMRLFPT